jgi:hypothetical protein
MLLLGYDLLLTTRGGGHYPVTVVISSNRKATISQIRYLTCWHSDEILEALAELKSTESTIGQWRDATDLAVNSCKIDVNTGFGRSGLGVTRSSFVQQRFAVFEIKFSNGETYVLVGDIPDVRSSKRNVIFINVP